MKSGLNKGQLIKWNDDRGFGFIKPSEGSKEVFLHISAVKTTGRRPKVGDTIFYELTTGTDGKISASGVSIQGVVSHSSTPQKIKTVTSKQKNRKRGLLETALGIGFLAAIVLFQMQFSSNRSPPPITSITKPTRLSTIPPAPTNNSPPPITSITKPTRLSTIPLVPTNRSPPPITSITKPTRLSTIPPAPTNNSPPPITSITMPGCVIKGNISVDTRDKLYHIPGMEDYDRTIISPAKGERWFCSESEALAAGWQRAPR